MEFLAAVSRDQFIPLLGFIWSLLSGPVHPSSGVHLEPADGISSSLFWGSSGARWWDQFIPLLGIIWSLLTGPVLPSSGVCLEPADRSGHPSSEVRLEPADRTSSYPLLEFVWSLLTGPVHPSSGVHLSGAGQEAGALSSVPALHHCNPSWLESRPYKGEFSMSSPYWL